MDSIQRQQILSNYCDNEMAKLKQLCYPKICKIGGISQMDYDDLYSIALDVLRDSTERFDESLNCKFTTFLNNNLQNKLNTYVRNKNREKRKCPGKMVYFDAFVEDGIELAEKVASDFKIENNLSEEIGFSTDGKVEKFMQSLSDLQRDILKLRMDEVPIKEIKERLNISNSEYNDAMESIRENRLMSLFNKGNVSEVRTVGGEIKMEQKVMIDKNDLIMDLDTTDSHTVEVRSLESLLRDKENGELDCNYISQRDPLQWSDEQVNKFLSRVLNNQPIPEIVVCETDPALYGEKISYLVEGLQRISYTEEFHENRIPVKSSGAEFTKIKYKKFEYENGKIKKDEKGRAVYTIDTFDITGKYYRELPEFLQKRFDNYNLSVTRFFNCSYELIDYHIRNYNNHEGMTKSHYGITSVSNTTSTKIKSISRKNPFFVNNVKYTNKAKKRGVLEEMVARSIIATFFVDDWKKESIDALKFVDKEVTEEQFDHFEDNANRLAKVADKSVKDMFNTTNIHVWMAVFDKFTTYKRFSDDKFIAFMKYFSENLHSKKINGRSYDEVNKRNTRDKSTVKNKISVLIDLMEEWLNVTEVDRVDETDIEKFVSECIGEKLEEVKKDMEQYNESLDNLLDITVRCNSKLMHEENRPSLLAMVAYSYKEDVDLEDWLAKYAEINSTYIRNQRENYLHMKKDFEKYSGKKGAVA